jgi:carbonic anhydrase
VPESDWGYSGDLGPKSWASRWAACAGSQQSPVDIRANESISGMNYVPHFNSA